MNINSRFSLYFSATSSEIFLSYQGEGTRTIGFGRPADIFKCISLTGRALDVYVGHFQRDRKRQTPRYEPYEQSCISVSPLF